MKPFYGIDRTTVKKNTFHEGDCFIAATVRQASRESYERTLNAAANSVEQTKLPLVLRGIRTACSWIFALIFIGIIRSLGEVTLAEGYENAPGLYWAMGISALIWGILTILSRRKSNAVTNTEEFAQAMHRLDGEVERIQRELEVPAGAKSVDVVQLTYRWKDGKLKINTQGMETTPYTNIPMQVFRREDALCLTDLENRYELPIRSMRCLKKVKKPLICQNWNKHEPINSEFYKPYKLSLDNYNRVRVKSYGLLELHHEGSDWAVWLPPYELNYISALTGLPITEE